MLMRRGTRGDIKIHMVGPDQRISCYLVRSSPPTTDSSAAVSDSLLIRLADFRSVVEEYLSLSLGGGARQQPVLYSTDC